MGKGSASLVTAISVLLSLGWIVILLYPGQWHYEDVELFFTFSVGLIRVQINKGLAGHIVGKAFSLAGGGKTKLGAFATAMGDGIEGSSNIVDVKDVFCAVHIPGLTNELCDMWVKAQYGGWAMLFCGLLTIMCLGLGAGFSNYFWNTCATKRGRTWTKGLLMSAPLCAACGVLQYGLLTFDFDFRILGGPDEVTFGFTFFVAACLAPLSAVPYFVIMSCSGIDQEPVKDDIDDPFLTDNDVQQSGNKYGATGYGGQNQSDYQKQSGYQNQSGYGGQSEYGMSAAERQALSRGPASNYVAQSSYGMGAPAAYRPQSAAYSVQYVERPNSSYQQPRPVSYSTGSWGLVGPAPSAPPLDPQSFERKTAPRNPGIGSEAQFRSSLSR